MVGDLNTPLLNPKTKTEHLSNRKIGAMNLASRSYLCSVAPFQVNHLHCAGRPGVALNQPTPVPSGTGRLVAMGLC